jgi:ribokinase
VFDVAVLGSANLDLVVGTARLPKAGETVLGHSYREFPGGKGLNQAVAASRIGATVAFVGAVGDDEAGERLLRVAANEGIDTRGVDVIGGVPTGRAQITVDADAQNCIVVVPGANATVSGQGAFGGHPPAAKILLAQLEIPIPAVIHAFAAARAAGSSTVLNPAPAAALPDDLLAITDIIVPNEHEVELLGGATSLQRRGVGVVVVTRGAVGVTIHDRDTSWTEPAVEVSAIDTTGAGDAFCGVLAARLALDEPLPIAVRWAAAAGAHAATVAGAVPSLPTNEQVRTLLDTVG